MAESISIHNSRSYHKDPAVIAPQVIAVASAVVLVVMRIYVRASMRRLWWEYVSLEPTFFLRALYFGTRTFFSSALRNIFRRSKILDSSSVANAEIFQ